MLRYRGCVYFIKVDTSHHIPTIAMSGYDINGKEFHDTQELSLTSYDIFECVRDCLEYKHARQREAQRKEEMADLMKRAKAKSSSSSPTKISGDNTAQNTDKENVITNLSQEQEDRANEDAKMDKQIEDLVSHPVRSTDHASDHHHKRTLDVHEHGKEGIEKQRLREKESSGNRSRQNSHSPIRNTINYDASPTFMNKHMTMFDVIKQNAEETAYDPALGRYIDASSVASSPNKQVIKENLSYINKMDEEKKGMATAVDYKIQRRDIERQKREKAGLTEDNLAATSLFNNSNNNRQSGGKPDPKGTCALCEREYRQSALLGRVSFKAVADWRAAHCAPIPSNDKRLNQAFILDSCKLCLFCTTFFDKDFSDCVDEVNTYESVGISVNPVVGIQEMSNNDSKEMLASFAKIGKESAVRRPISALRQDLYVQQLKARGEINSDPNAKFLYNYKDPENKFFDVGKGGNYLKQKYKDVIKVKQLQNRGMLEEKLAQGRAEKRNHAINSSSEIKSRRNSREGSPPSTKASKGNSAFLTDAMMSDVAEATCDTIQERKILRGTANSGKSTGGGRRSRSRTTGRTGRSSSRTSTSRSRKSPSRTRSRTRGTSSAHAIGRSDRRSRSALRSSTAGDSTSKKGRSLSKRRSASKNRKLNGSLPPTMRSKSSPSKRQWSTGRTRGSTTGARSRSRSRGVSSRLYSQTSNKSDNRGSSRSRSKPVNRRRHSDGNVLNPSKTTRVGKKTTQIVPTERKPLLLVVPKSKSKMTKGNSVIVHGDERSEGVTIEIPVNTTMMSVLDPPAPIYHNTANGKGSKKLKAMKQNSMAPGRVRAKSEKKAEFITTVESQRASIARLSSKKDKENVSNLSQKEMRQSIEALVPKGKRPLKKAVVLIKKAQNAYDPTNKIEEIKKNANNRSSRESVIFHGTHGQDAIPSPSQQRDYDELLQSKMQEERGRGRMRVKKSISPTKSLRNSPKKGGKPKASMKAREEDYQELELSLREAQLQLEIASLQPYTLTNHSKSDNGDSGNRTVNYGGGKVVILNSDGDVLTEVVLQLNETIQVNILTLIDQTQKRLNQGDTLEEVMSFICSIFDTAQLQAVKTANNSLQQIRLRKQQLESQLLCTDSVSPVKPTGQYVDFSTNKDDDGEESEEDEAIIPANKFTQIALKDIPVKANNNIGNKAMQDVQALVTSSNKTNNKAKGKNQHSPPSKKKTTSFGDSPNSTSSNSSKNNQEGAIVGGVSVKASPEHIESSIHSLDAFDMQKVAQLSSLAIHAASLVSNPEEETLLEFADGEDTMDLYMFATSDTVQKAEAKDNWSPTAVIPQEYTDAKSSNSMDVPVNEANHDEISAASLEYGNNIATTPSNTSIGQVLTNTNDNDDNTENDIQTWSSLKRSLEHENIDRDGSPIVKQQQETDVVNMDMEADTTTSIIHDNTDAHGQPNGITLDTTYGGLRDMRMSFDNIDDQLSLVKVIEHSMEINQEGHVTEMDNKVAQSIADIELSTHHLSDAYAHLGNQLYGENQYEACMEAYQKSYELMVESNDHIDPQEDLQRITSMINLSLEYKDEVTTTMKARDLLRKSSEYFTDDSIEHAKTRFIVADSLLQVNKTATSVNLLNESYNTLSAQLGTDHSMTALVKDKLIESLEKLKVPPAVLLNQGPDHESILRQKEALEKENELKEDLYTSTVKAEADAVEAGDGHDDALMDLAFADDNNNDEEEEKEKEEQEETVQSKKGVGFSAYETTDDKAKSPYTQTGVPYISKKNTSPSPSKRLKSPPPALSRYDPDDEDEEYESDFEEVSQSSSLPVSMRLSHKSQEGVSDKGMATIDQQEQKRGLFSNNSSSVSAKDNVDGMSLLTEGQIREFLTSKIQAGLSEAEAMKLLSQGTNGLSFTRPRSKVRDTRFVSNKPGIELLGNELKGDGYDFAAIHGQENKNSKKIRRNVGFA